MADIKREEEVGATDTAPLSKKIRVRVVVKVEVLRLAGHVRVTSKDRRIDRVYPLDMLEKRLRPGEAVCFFEAHEASTVGTLEIGERLETLPEDKRW